MRLYIFLFLGILCVFFVNYLIMINTAKIITIKSILKQNIKLKLKPLKSLENINIFSMPPCIQDQDIVAMFKAIISLMREKINQEQTQKFLALKLKYDRLKYLYNKSRKLI